MCLRCRDSCALGGPLDGLFGMFHALGMVNIHFQ